MCRYHLFTEALAAIEADGGGLDAFSRGWDRFGFNRGTGPASGVVGAAAASSGTAEVPGVWYREWAPAATAASVIGDFNGWDLTKTPCVKDDFVRGWSRNASRLTAPMHTCQSRAHCIPRLCLDLLSSS